VEVDPAKYAMKQVLFHLAYVMPLLAIAPNVIILDTRLY
jgi:hypothetical protein